MALWLIAALIWKILDTPQTALMVSGGWSASLYVLTVRMEEPATSRMEAVTASQASQETSAKMVRLNNSEIEVVFLVLFSTNNSHLYTMLCNSWMIDSLVSGLLKRKCLFA